MVLFLHNRYRVSGGEERVVEDLMGLVGEQLGEQVELLDRDSATLGRGGAAAGLLRGGLKPEEVASAVRLTGARVVHAHNLNPTFGWRALAAAREAGARVVLHLHQYRMVCAIGVCFTRGAECTRCHGRDTLPGVRLNCRGSLGESVAYGASLALWQRRLAEQADAVIVPSVFARERLRELGAPLDWDRVHVLAPPVREPVVVSPVARGPYALVVSRLAAEKGIDVAIDACRVAGLGLVIAGDGPELGTLRAQAEASGRVVEANGNGAGSGNDQSDRGELARGEVRFVGHVDDAELAALRAGAAIALAPSRSAETFGLAAAEAMAAGLPVAASRVGALPELIGDEGLVPPGDAGALAQAIERLTGDRVAGARGLERVRAVCSPERVAAGLASIYDGAT
jgi:glycosyltransferase involved in cell wall biosynthesis